jgi:GT2 family glycosyltransferase
VTAPRAAASGLTAVVLNYRTADDTVLAVRSLEASWRTVGSIVVVDNGSGDGSVAALRAALPGVSIVESATNRGFPAGVNLGIRAALARRADLVLLVNSDVVVPPDVVGRLEAGLREHAGAGIAGPVVLSRSCPDRVMSMGLTFSPATGRMRHRGFGTRFDRLASPGIQPVDAVAGCLMLVRREVFERIGLFAEEYFFSLEDLDFCLAARAGGFLSVCVPDAFVYHEGALSIGARSPRRLYFAARNHLLLARRRAPRRPLVRALARSGSIVALNVAHALVSAGTPRAAGLLAVARGVADHLRGRYGAGP